MIQSQSSTGILERTTSEGHLRVQWRAVASHFSLSHPTAEFSCKKQSTFFFLSMKKWPSQSLYHSRPNSHCPVRNGYAHSAGADCPERGRAAVQLARARLQVRRRLLLRHTWTTGARHMMWHCKCSGLGTAQRKICPRR